MVCALYTLKKQYQNKEIYIWNVNRDSIAMFIEMAFRRIVVQGFVCAQEKYAGELYINCPVVTLEQIQNNENAVLFVSDRISADVLPDANVIYWSDALELNANLYGEKIIVYGTGYGAERLSDFLEEKGIRVELYCVTQKDRELCFRGKKVIEANELESYSDHAILISVRKKQYRREILQTLADFKGTLYEKTELFIRGDDCVNFIQNIDLAIKKNKKVYLYSEKNVTAGLIEDVLRLYDIEVEGYVNDTEDIENGINNIYEVAYDGIDDKLIIISTEDFEENPVSYIRSRDNVELAGFTLEDSNYTSLKIHGNNSKEWLLNKWPQYHDPLTGASRIYEKSGWKVYGMEGEGRIRIVILGGSTSSEQFHPENWVSKLYYKLKEQNICTTIYNGAFPSDDIVDEMLRLLRDGYILRPHIVISMSGVNNLHYKESGNQFNEERIIGWVKKLASREIHCMGLCSDESLFSFWNRNVRLLKLIAEFFGAEFLGFLQPMNITMQDMSLREKGLYEAEAHLLGAADFSQNADHGKGYINLLRLFEHQDDMYFDVCHYTDKGHEMIANEVLKTVMLTIERWGLDTLLSKKN